MLVIALSTPGNATTATIAAVALLLGVLLMARSRRVEAGPAATSASLPPEIPVTATQPATAPPSADHLPEEFTAAEPAVTESAPAEQEAHPEPKRLRLGGARFGETAHPVAPDVGDEPTAGERDEPTAGERDEPTAGEHDEPTAGEPEEAPAKPRRIRLGGPRFGPTAAPSAASEPTAPEPYVASEPSTASDPSAAPEPSASPEPPVEPAWKRFAGAPEEAPAEPQRIRLGGARFKSEPSPVAEPERPADDPDPAAPAPAGPEPATPSPAPASRFRQGTIRLRERR